jgi:hypothetical protein
MVEASGSVSIRYVQTDVFKSIELATTVDRNRPDTTTYIATYRSFFDSLSKPDEFCHTKEGSQFTLGPCLPRRTASNLSKCFVVVIDADKSIVENQEAVDGAPEPVKVHEALKSWGISHALYTTHSHGGPRGNRYRIVLPIECNNPAELKAVAVYIVETLQMTAGLPLALSRESYTWGAGWYFPRVAYEGAEYVYLEYIGQVPVAEDLANHYNFHTLGERKIGPPKEKQERWPGSPVAMFCEVMPVQYHLEKHGYTYVSQSISIDSDNQERAVFRYRSPGSGSEPGTTVFKDSHGVWRAYSFHGNDPLNNGFANDAFDVFMILNKIADHTEALTKVVPELQAYIHEQLNTAYPTVIEGGTKPKLGNVYVDEFGATQIRLMDFSQLNTMMLNHPGVPAIITAEDGKEMVKMLDRAEYWKKCKERVVYNGAYYVPCPVLDTPQTTIYHGDTPYYNMFRSWHVQPRKGNYPLLAWHLKYAICGGIDEEYEYLLDWFAHLFQIPAEKPEVAIVLQGGRGWGKTIIFSELAKALGTHALVVGNNNLLTGRFNRHIRGKLLLVVEESFWAGNHKDRGVLQHMITDGATTYEAKGVDAESGISMLRIVMSTNDDWAAPAATDERRLFLPSLSDAAYRADIVNGQKGSYFPRLVTEMRGGGLDGFIHAMGTRKFDAKSIRNVPVTAKLSQQKELSLDWLDRWFLEVLQTGVIRSRTFGVAEWTDAGACVPLELLKEALVVSSPGSSKFGEHGLLTMFGLRTRKIFGPNRVKKRLGADGVRFMFTSIVEFRTVFENYVRFPIQWAVPDQAAAIQETLSENYHESRPTAH